MVIWQPAEQLKKLAWLSHVIYSNFNILENYLILENVIMLATLLHFSTYLNLVSNAVLINFCHDYISKKIVFNLVINKAESRLPQVIMSS